jgi:transposase-like protein
MNPPFCPNPACAHHHDSPEDYAGHWKHAGSYMTLVVGSVPRFKCTACNRGYSERTFAHGYYTKRTLDAREIQRAVSQGESVSSIARHLGASTASIQNRIDRLARASLAMHADLTATLALGEHLVADGFESFDRSQYHPNQINILVGKESQFLYSLAHVTIRRKGRMSRVQKEKRRRLEELWRAPRAGIRTSFARLMATIDPLWDRARLPGLQLWTDEHRDYPAAILDTRPLLMAMHDGSFSHMTWPSTAPRHVLNPLFAVNYYDRELRKDLASFRRESTCFTRNVANGLSRFACHMAYHNYQKPYRVESLQIDDSVHAEVAGIDRRLIEAQLAGFYTDRPFISQHKISDETTRIWLKRAPTPLKKKPDRLPAYASAGWIQAATN